MKLFIFAFCITYLNPLFVYASELEILTEEYPPYNYMKNNKIEGFSTEVVRAILKELNKEHLAIHMQPWARAYRTAQERPNVLIYTMARSPAREKIFKWVGPISDRKVWMYKLASRTDIQVTSLENAKKYSISGVKNSSIVMFLIENGFKVGKNINLIHNEDLNFKKFIAGRVDLISKVPMAMAMELKSEGMDMSLVEPLILVSGDLFYYLAFSLETPDKTINEWQKALLTIKENKTYAKIKRKFMQ